MAREVKEEHERHVPEQRKYFRKEGIINCVKDCREVKQPEVTDMTVAFESMEITGILSKSCCGKDESLI